jgi:hypothetical protein
LHKFQFKAEFGMTDARIADIDPVKSPYRCIDIDKVMPTLHFSPRGESTSMAMRFLHLSPARHAR